MFLIKVKTPRVNPTKSHQNSPANSVLFVSQNQKKKLYI